jgi:hypothetical protein
MFLKEFGTNVVFNKGWIINQSHHITKLSIVSNPPAMRVAAQINRIARQLPVFRRQLHQHPELSGAELLL